MAKPKVAVIVTVLVLGAGAVALLALDRRPEGRPVLSETHVSEQGARGTGAAERAEPAAESPVQGEKSAPVAEGPPPAEKSTGVAEGPSQPERKRARAPALVEPLPASEREPTTGRSEPEREPTAGWSEPMREPAQPVPAETREPSAPRAIARTGAMVGADFVDHAGSSYALERVSCVLDGVRVCDVAGPGRGRLTLFDRSVPAGKHTLSIVAHYRGAGGLFSYMKGFHFTVENARTFEVPDNHVVRVGAVVVEAGGPTVPMSRRLGMELAVTPARRIAP